MFKPFDSITQVDFEVFINKEDTSQVKPFLTSTYSATYDEMQSHKLSTMKQLGGQKQAN